MMPYDPNGALQAFILRQNSKPQAYPQQSGGPGNANYWMTSANPQTPQGDTMNQWRKDLSGAFGMNLEGQYPKDVTEYKQQEIFSKQYADIYNQALKAYDPASIAKIYANAYGQLGKNQGSSVANAQRTAGMQAASGSLANPGAFVLGAGANARQPYANAFAELGQQESQAQLSGQKGIADTMMMLTAASRGDKKAQDQLDYQYELLKLEYDKLNRAEADPATWLGTGFRAMTGFVG
jgi:hypothetical protein